MLGSQPCAVSSGTRVVSEAIASNVGRAMRIVVRARRARWSAGDRAVILPRSTRTSMSSAAARPAASRSPPAVSAECDCSAEGGATTTGTPPHTRRAEAITASRSNARRTSTATSASVRSARSSSNRLARTPPSGSASTTSTSRPVVVVQAAARPIVVAVTPGAPCVEARANRVIRPSPVAAPAGGADWRRRR